MLPKNRRISRNDLKQASGLGKSLNSSHFFIKVIHTDTPTSKFAVSVSKKVSKLAVVRNKVRRRVYSAIRNQFLGLKPAFYIVSAKPGADKLKIDELVSELTHVFSSFLK